jgi:hypothetical protein
MQLLYNIQLHISVTEGQRQANVKDLLHIEKQSTNTKFTVREVSRHSPSQVQL